MSRLAAIDSGIVRLRCRRASAAYADRDVRRALERSELVCAAGVALVGAGFALLFSNQFALGGLALLVFTGL